MADYSVDIQAKLSGFEKINQLEKKLNSLKNNTVKINVELAGDAAKLLNGQMPNITSNAIKAGQAVGKGLNQGIKSAKFNGFYKDYFKRSIVEKELLQQQRKLDSYAKKFELGDYKAQQVSMQKQLGKYDGTTSQSLESAKKFATEFKNIQSVLGKHFDGTQKLSNNELISYFNKAQDAAKKFGNEMKIVASEAIKPFNAMDASTASNKTLTWLNNNTKAMKKYGNAFKDLAARQKAATNNDELKQYNAEFRNLVSNVQRDGLTGKSFFHEIGSGLSRIGQFVGTYAILQKGVQTLKQMGQAVLDVDTAMTNLYKVTDETSAKYNEFLNNAGKTSKEIGRDISSYITQTSEWAKLGYNMDQSANLAKISSIYSNVGEVDDKTAVSDLVTVLKAYNMDDSQAINIVDQLNELGNTYATDAKSLGDGLKNMASTMAMSGVSLEKSLAILTGGTEITQDAGELGNAIKVAVLRMRGQKGKLEEIGEYADDVESVSKMQTQILNMTKGAVNIMDASDPTSFRDYYDVMSDIAEVLPKLNETDQADLIETLFGKNRANQGQAILQAFQSGQIQKAYQTALNAEGSAQKEQDRWMESLEARLCLVA